MAVENGYCTVQDLRDHLADSGDHLPAAVLEKAINGASRAIDSHCGRRFWLDTDVSTRTYPVPSVDGAYVDDIGTRAGLVVAIGVNGVDFPTTLTVDRDFILEPRNADKFATTDFGAYAFWQIRPVIGGLGLYVDPFTPTLQVTARFGWSKVPDDVVEACILKAASLFKRKDSPNGVAGFGEFGAVRISRRDSDVLELLAGYQIPVA